MRTRTSSLAGKGAVVLQEAESREGLIRDLQKKGISIVNLYTGTFDLIVEGKRPFVCELKRMAEGTRFSGDREAFKFTKEQTREIMKMKFPPHL